MKNITKLVVAIVISALFASATVAAAEDFEADGKYALYDGNHGKKYLTAKVDEKSLKEFQAKGCNVAKKQRKIASLDCPESAAKELSLTEDVAVFAMENDEVSVSDIGSDKQTGADRVWTFGYTGKNRLIAVIDTGIDRTHPELANSYAGGFDFANNDIDPMDDNGHGTHVAGIITANSGTAKGVAPDAKILALKVLKADGSGSFSDVISAIYYAVDGPDGVYGTSDDPKVDAISMSIGSTPPFTYTGANCDSDYPELADSIKYAVSKGVVVVAAAGNSGTNGVSMPGCMSGALTVGAVDSKDVRASFSGVGNSLDIMAPGVGIYSTVPGGYGYMSGTSMSTPYISGVVALMKDANPTLSVKSLQNALFSTAKRIGNGNTAYYGKGRVNAYGAVNAVKQTSKQQRRR